MAKRKKRLLLLATLVLLGLAVFLLVKVLTSPAFLVPRIERALNRKLGTRSRLEGLDFSILGGCRIGELRAFLPEEHAETQAFLLLHEVQVTHEVVALLKGEYRIRRVMVDQAEIHITPDSLAWVRGLKSAESPKDRTEKWPAVEIMRATVNVDVPQVLEPFQVEEVSCQLSPDDMGTLRGTAAFEVHGNPFRAEIQAGSLGQDMRVRVETPGVRLEGLPGLHPNRIPGHLRDLTCSGTGQGEIVVSLPRGDTGRPTWEADLTFQDLDLSHTSWPARISGARGRCRITNTQVSLEEFSGRAAGGYFRISNARAELRGDGIGDAAVRGYVRGLDVEQVAKSNLPAPAAAILTEAGLESGKADINFDFASKPDERPVFEVTVGLSQGKAQPRAFPVPFREVELEARYHSGGRLEVNRFQAIVDEGQIRANGFVARSSDGKQVPDLQLIFAGMPLKDDILRHLPESVQKVAAAIGLKEGQLDGTLLLNPRCSVLDATVSNIRMRPPLFPYSLTNVSGEIYWSSKGSRVLIDNLKARHGSGMIYGTATTNLKESPTLDLVLEGSNLPVDKDLRGLLPSEQQKVWDQWRPKGHFDLSLDMRDKRLGRQAAGETWLTGLNAEARLKGVSLNHHASGIWGRHLQGRLALNETGITVSGLGGRSLGIEFDAKGWCTLGQEPQRASLLMTSSRTRLTPDLLKEWPEAIAKHVQELDLAGEFEVHAELRKDADGHQGLAASSTVMLHDLVLRTAKTSIETEGIVQLGIDDLLTKGAPVRCKLHLERVRASRFYGSDVRAELQLSGNMLNITRSEMHTYGGTLSVEEGLCELPGLTWQAKARVSHLDLVSLMAALGLEGRDAPSGSLRGTVELKGHGFETSALNAKGELKIDRGRLYQLPIILSVLKLFEFRLPRESPVSDVYAAFHVDEETVHFDDVLLSGGTVPLHIRGTVGIRSGVALKDQAIDLFFSVPRHRGLMDEIPIFNWIKHLTVDKLRGRVLQARVVGTVGEYQTKSVLTLISAPASSMWKLLQKVSPAEAKKYLIPRRIEE